MSPSNLARALWVVAAVLAAAPHVHAQQPFVVDDAEVGAKGLWHLELSHQIDRLRPGARPVVWQGTFECEIDYGLASRIEVGVLIPVILLVSDGPTHRRAIAGIGDSAIAAKVRLTGNAEARHAAAASASLELPTGSHRRGLGSSLVDVRLTLVSQHRLSDVLTLRGNVGALAAGNTQSGAIGIRERGVVLTAGSSLVRALGRRAQLGAELTMAWSEKTSFGGSSIGWTVGTNVVLRDGVTLDVGVVGGWLDASPLAGLQVGTSIDLR